MNRFKYLIILTSLLACSYNVFADSTASTSNKKLKYCMNAIREIDLKHLRVYL